MCTEISCGRWTTGSGVERAPAPRTMTGSHHQLRWRLIIDDEPHTGSRKQDAFAITAALNDIVETWVRQAPEQWLWVHRRWPNG